MAETLQRLLSVNELSELIGLRPSTIFKYTSTGVLPHVKIGTRCLFDPARIKEWVEAHSVEPVGSKRRRREKAGAET